MRGESWKPIEGYPYEVSDRGRVRSLRKVLALNQRRDGHMQISLYCDGARKAFYVHVLVLEAFVETRPEGLQCCHRDGNPKHNWVSNLRWGSPSENYDDQRRHGVNCTGERHGSAKLSQTDVEEIRRRRQEGETQQTIATAFKISRSQIGLIVTYKRWRNKRSKLSSDFLRP